VSVLPPRQLIEAVKASAGEQGLMNLPPLALSARLLEGFDPADPATLYTPSMVVEPIVHPVLDAVLTVARASRRGPLTFSAGLGQKSSTRGFDALMRHVDPRALVPEDLLLTPGGRQRDPQLVRLDNRAWQTERMLWGTPLQGRVPAGFNDTLYRKPELTPFGVITMSSDGRNLWLKFHTRDLVCPDHPEVVIDLRPVGAQQRDPRPVRPASAIAVLEWAAAEGLTVVDPSPDGVVATLRRKLSATLVAWPSHGRPAQAKASVGVRHAAGVASRSGVKVPARGHGSWVSLSSGCTCRTCVQGRRHAARSTELDSAALAGLSGDWSGELAIHPAVADVAALAAAEPVDDHRLRPYQREVVGMHLATTLGFVNALSPGMGKTICVLDALRRRAEATPGWRGLVVVEANVRRQWATEAAAWFPAARLVVAESAAAASDVIDALTTAGADPVLVVTSYALMSAVDALPEPVEPADCSLAAALARTTWDDLVADEAACLRNTASKQSAALWRLRRTSGVAMALTGTPITRSLDDVGRLVSWCRNDPDLFTGARLDTTIDLATDEGLQSWRDALGPLLVRRDKTEIADELPGLRAEVVHLNPSPAERSLAHAARNELRRVYDELAAATARAANLDPDNPRWVVAREQLAAARGAWLGGTQLARMAASDPVALTTSESAGAALLAAQGLVAAACAATGTKRRWAIEKIAELVADGKQVLLFTEFATVARGLLDDLAEAGIAAGGVLGGGGRRRDANVADFCAGRLSTLVSTSSGERGLNLQQASVVIHYDLPWTPDAVLQRTGRVERIGASADEITVLFPVMSDTIEERVAALVVSRAAAAMRALDGSRGVKATETDMGRALGELVRKTGSADLGAKDASLLEITRQLLT
jgi:superfamily II DNA or RNA helicase